MSDRTCVALTIGGLIKAEMVEDLIDALFGEVDIDWNEGASKEEIRELIRKAVKEGLPLKFRTSEVRNGEHEALEDYLRNLGLVYYRWDDGFPGAWSARGSYWACGMEEPQTWDVQSDTGVPTVTCAAIRNGWDTSTLETMLEDMDATQNIPPFIIEGQWPAADGTQQVEKPHTAVAADPNARVPL